MARPLHAAMLDALDAHVAAVDERGTVVAVNRAWEDAAPVLYGHPVGVGADYPSAYDSAPQSDVGAARVARSLREMLAGRLGSFAAEHPGHVGGRERWFSLRASLLDGVPARIVIELRDTTARVAAEDDRMRREIQLLAQMDELRDALDEGRFVLYAQPIVEVGSGAVFSHELLIRMVDRDGAVRAPEGFLLTAERCGLIREIDRWVIHRAAELAGKGHRVELNVSAISLGDPGLFEEFRAAMERCGAAPQNIIVELTETALMHDETVAAAFMQRVGRLGCEFALDDFGTGFGGFGYLKRLPVDYLKIDIEFVRDLRTNAASRHVVQAVVSLAGAFGQRTVAEGVEDEETLALVAAMGVDLAQGYGLGKPLPLDGSLLSRPR